MKRRFGVTILALLLAASPAAAQRVRLDDSPSPVDSLHVELAWDADALALAASSLSSRAGELPPATGRLPGVDVRLDTREFVGRQARIFLSIAGVPEGADLELRWEASGRFLPGAVRPGQSALVFEGPIEQPTTGILFSFVLLVGDGASTAQNSLEVIYELEALP